jgi:hypothetical protein
VIASKHTRPKTGQLALALALLAAPLLSACSGSGPIGEDKLAAAQKAAQRAEAAADRAEDAATRANTAQPAVVEAEPDTDMDPQDPSVSDPNPPPPPSPG